MASPAIVKASVVDSGSTYNYNGTDWPIAYDQTNNLYWFSLQATDAMTIKDVTLSSLITGWKFASLSEIQEFF